MKIIPTKFKLKQFFALGILFLLAATVLFPPMARIANRSIGMDDLLTVFLFFLLIGYLLTNPQNIFFGNEGLLLTALWVVLLTSGVVISTIVVRFSMGQFRIPTEMWQYVKRMVFFFTSCYVAYTSLTTSQRFQQCLLWVLLAALLIGTIQIMPGSLGDYLADLYARTDKQLEGLNRTMTQMRNYGVAGHSTAWGGFSVFGAAVALGGIIGRYGEKKVMRIEPFSGGVILALAFFNTAFSGSRVALVALVAVFFSFSLAGLFYAYRKVAFAFNYLFSAVVMATGFFYMFREKIIFLIVRFDVLIAESGGNRVDQVDSALSLLTNVYSWLFGVGNAAARSLAVSHGTEVEPVYLLVNYGILGVTLRYGILLFVFISACRQFRLPSRHDRALAFATALSLVGYTIFSLGYFFYQELRVGMLPWLLFGWVTGVYLREKRFRKNYLDKKGLVPQE